MVTSSRIIDKIYKNSIEIIDSLDKKTLNVDELYVMIKDSKYKPSKIGKITTRRKKNMVNIYTKESILDEILFLTENRFKHLKEIRYIVNIDDLIEYILPEKVYIDKVKVYYTNIIIDKVLEKYYDYESSKLLSNLKLELLDIERCVNNKIAHNIDKYYISKITN